MTGGVFTFQDYTETPLKAGHFKAKPDNCSLQCVSGKHKPAHQNRMSGLVQLSKGIQRNIYSKLIKN